MELPPKKIAIFLENLYEDLEFWYPYFRMREAGAQVVAVAPQKGRYQSKHGLPARADFGVKELKAEDYDALIIPGGYAPDYMRRHKAMLDFVRQMNAANRPIAAICHGGWLLASAEIIKDKSVTSFYAIKDDITHAGARWVDREVVQDGNIITSRTPEDLPAFCRKIIAALK